MTWPNSHKTVFVLDHSPLMSRSCDMQVELDLFAKSRTSGFILLPPVSKSLWTCSTEAVFEYCRILWDVYPTNKLLRFFVSDVKANPIGGWAATHQNLQNTMNSFAQIGPPVQDSLAPDCNILTGLTVALEALTECTPMQIEKRAQESSGGPRVFNRGRVICIGTFRDDSFVRSLESYFQETLVQINKRCSSSEHLMPISHCDLVLINIYPNSQTSKIKEHVRLELSSVLSCELISLRACRWLASRMCTLVLQHFDLASTTVTGIPMKEEQNASSSANYDVEIFHPAAAHAEILKMKNESALFVMKEGYDYKTVTLKWCTPRASSNCVELWPCSSAHRISPVDVTSRPSSCLTNFLLGGRSVMLELPRGSGRLTSHMLAAHGGEIFLHSLLNSRSVIEDPPSISEGCGGRVTDYRIPDFGELMKENKLTPYPEPNRLGNPPVEKSVSRLERYTQYWPLTISSTTIFNLGAHLEPLSRLMLRETLTDDQVIECKKVIYNLLAMETRSESLPPAASAGFRDRGKGNKREEQYKALFQELENFVRVHSRTEQHQRILACLLECRPKATTGTPVPPSVTVKEEKPESGIIRATTDSPLSPVPVAKVPKLEFATTKPYSSGRSLLSMWTANITADQMRKQVEFVGRAKAGLGIAKLYPHLDKDGKEHDEKIQKRLQKLERLESRIRA